MQVALNSHDGPLFLEQANHIPEEYHKYFGIQPIISSPRSESNTLVTNPDDENSNSMMSANSEKEGLGAQMVLEQNLGVCGHDDDEDDDSNSKQKRNRHESSNSKMDSLLNDEESNLSSDLKKSPKNNVEMQIPSTVVTSASVVNENVGEELQQQRTRLPSFSSIIAGIVLPLIIPARIINFLPFFLRELLEVLKI